MRFTTTFAFLHNHPISTNHQYHLLCYLDVMGFYWIVHRTQCCNVHRFWNVIFRTGPVVSMKSWLMEMHQKLWQLLLLTAYAEFFIKFLNCTPFFCEDLILPLRHVASLVTFIDHTEKKTVILTQIEMHFVQLLRKIILFILLGIEGYSLVCLFTFV